MSIIIILKRFISQKQLLTILTVTVKSIGALCRAIVNFKHYNDQVLPFLY